MTVDTSSDWVTVPGLSQTFAVPAGAIVYVSTDGGVRTTSGDATGFSDVHVGLSIDGVDPFNGGLFQRNVFQRLIVANTATLDFVHEDWGFGEIVPLAPGTHTIAVRTKFATSFSSPAVVSGSGTNALRGQLTVLVLKT